MRIGTSIDLLEAARKLDGRLNYQGLDISIENKAGSVRKGVDPDGNKWATKMMLPYGYIRRTEGTDGDHVDCFIGPDKTASKVYVIHIKDPKTGKYDEDKCMLGMYSAKHARKVFNKHYDNPDKFYQGMTTMSMADFKKKVLDKKNHGEQITANNEAISMAYIDPIPSFRPPSGKHGKSRVPTDSPGETDDSMLDVTKKKESEDQRKRLLQNLAKPMPFGHTEVQHPTGGVNEYLEPRKMLKGHPKS